MDLELLRNYCADAWSRILSHPFVEALGRGHVEDDRLQYFVGQDYRYLNDFSLTLTMASQKAPNEESQRVLEAHAANVFVVEQDLHKRVAPMLGLTPESLEQTSNGPVTQAYTNHLVRTACTGSFADIIAALLPCYVTYREIGHRLYAKGLPDHPVAQDWILTYHGAAYDQAVREIEEIASVIPVETTADQRSVMESYHHSMRYERLFWEQALRLGLFDV